MVRGRRLLGEKKTPAARVWLERSGSGFAGAFVCAVQLKGFANVVVALVKETGARAPLEIRGQWYRAAIYRRGVLGRTLKRFPPRFLDGVLECTVRNTGWKRSRVGARWFENEERRRWREQNFNVSDREKTGLRGFGLVWAGHSSCEVDAFQGGLCRLNSGIKGK